jgi:hypothetical protein
LPACTINTEASPQFRQLRENWKRNGYPNIDTDLADAFKAITENIQAKKGARIQAGPIGGEVEVYKYRQNSTDIQRGASYGWRIIALLHKPSGTMYPIIVYPKTQWSNASPATMAAAVKEIRQILGYCISPGCDGRMVITNPAEVRWDGGSAHTKMQCEKCRSTQWASAPPLAATHS